MIFVRAKKSLCAICSFIRTLLANPTRFRQITIPATQKSQTCFSKREKY